MIIRVGADIADMREGEQHDLVGIGRIGEDFLIAGDRCIETQFADSHARRPCTLAQKDCSIGERQCTCFASGLIFIVQYLISVRSQHSMRESVA